MPRRLKLIVAYDGAPFAGWQSQKHGNTIQDHLEKAFVAVAGSRVRVHGAGRTDAGVHALGQCAHADVPETLTAAQWVAALNASLPATIRTLRARYVAADFHARFAAKGKVYRYRIWNDRILPPLEVGRAWHMPAPLDFERMISECRAFEGRHDFAAFAANRGEPVEDTIRTIESARLRRTSRCIVLDLRGDGFLYKMVRMMAGALVLSGRGRVEAGFIRQRLAEPNCARAGQRIVAPAGGLFLLRVRY